MGPCLPGGGATAPFQITARASMSCPAKARVLLVDDDPVVSSGPCEDGAPSFALVIVSSRDEGLERLEKEGPFAVIVASDRLPGDSGEELLNEVADRYPETSRVMLTAQSHLESADGQVNRGSLFRFLMKPCEPALFWQALHDAVEQYRLRLAERDLLRSTVQGVVEVLVEVMAINNPAAFGRSRRVQQLVAAAAFELGIDSTWELEMASLLSQLGFVTIPDVIVERAAMGQILTEEQQRMLEEHPALSSRLVGQVPLLETVAAIMTPGAAADEAAGPRVRLGARLLRAATEYEELVALRADPDQARAALADPTRGHDARLVRAITCAGAALHCSTLGSFPLARLQSGMVLAEDLRAMGRGRVILKRGSELTESSLQRLRNYRAVGLLEVDEVRAFSPTQAAAGRAAA